MDVLIVTHAGEPYSDQDDHVLEAALAGEGVAARVVAWSDPQVDWSAAAMVVVRTTWDYFDRRDEFLDWTRRVEQVSELHNPAEVLAWNTHKGYLAELEERGAPIVPTAFLGRGDRVDLGGLLASRDWPDAVCKPAVSAGAIGLRRVGANSEAPPDDQAALDALLVAGDVLVQPFVPSVLDGELSIVLLDGEVSHAVRKVPAPGEIRVQQEYGGRYEQVPVPADAGDLARWVVEATGHRLLAARVDLLQDKDGSWMVAELEVTEPSLYLQTVPGAATTLARAIATRLAARQDVP